MADSTRPSLPAVPTIGESMSVGDEDADSTETIDFEPLLPLDLTSTGSFNLEGIKSTSLARLLNALPVPIFIVDQSHTVAFANRACQPRTGGRAVFEGQHISSLAASKKTSLELMGLIEEVVWDRRPRIGHGALQFGKESIWGRLHVRSLRLGPARGVLVLLEDMTLEMKQVSMQRQRDDLERTVKDRTSELEQINEQLRREVEEGKRDEEQLVSSAREKDMLLRDLHLRVKNSLQLVASLLSIQSAYVHDEGVLGLLRDAENRLRSMGLVHEKLGDGGDFSAFQVAEYVGGLLDSLLFSYGDGGLRITLKKEIEDVSLSMDTVILLGFILTELVSNALKHSFPDHRRGEVKVSLQRVPDEQFELLVSDNGVGMPADIDWERPQSRGLDIVAILVRQLDGQIEFRSNGGTEFRLRFKDRKRQKQPA